MTPAQRPVLAAAFALAGAAAPLAAASCNTGSPAQPMLGAPGGGSGGGGGGGGETGSPGDDGATASDGSPSPEDAPSVADAAPEGAADAFGDAFPTCPGMSFADCGTFTDLRADAADRTIHFMNYAYDPQCAELQSGQSITFTGDFVVHPLVQSCGPADMLERRLPLDASPGTETSQSFKLTAAGVYGYYCLDHGNAQGVGMSGAILVQP